MIVRLAMTWLLLLAAAAAFLLTSVGLLCVRDTYDRIQYTYPAATIGVAAIVAAVVLSDPISQAGLKAIICGLVVCCTNPVLSHAVARAARVREKGRWQAEPDEHIRVAKDR